MTIPAPTKSRATFDRIVRVETMLWNRCDDALQSHTGPPLSRLEVLRVVAEVENCRVNDIASRLMITVGAVSKLVDRLEASGHCRRNPNPDDRRSSVLSVTDVGWAVLKEAERILEPLLEQCFAQVDLDALNDALVQVEQLSRGNAALATSSNKDK